MKFLFAVHNYYDFYTRYLSEHPDLLKKSYEDQCIALYGQLFYESDNYVHGVRQLGHEAYQVIMNCNPLQCKWAKEHSIIAPPTWLRYRPWRWYWTRILKQPTPVERYQDKIFLEQIKRIRPDILYIFAGVPVTEWLLSEARKYASYLVCEWSCGAPEDYPFHSYDLIISSAKPVIGYFRDKGYKVEYLPHAFDERFLTYIGKDNLRDRGAVFIGTVAPLGMRDRVQLLEYLCRHIDFDLYGGRTRYLPEDSPLRRKSRGEAFGLDMYRLYSRYKIALHTHGVFAGDFVGAKRLFEVTGVGTMLLTDAKKDLGDFFEVGKEVVSYTDPADCLDKLRYYLTHEDECAKIAEAGQRRTLQDHTFKIRIKKLTDILKRELNLK